MVKYATHLYRHVLLLSRHRIEFGTAGTVQSLDKLQIILIWVLHLGLRGKMEAGWSRMNGDSISTDDDRNLTGIIVDLTVIQTSQVRMGCVS